MFMKTKQLLFVLMALLLGMTGYNHANAGNTYTNEPVTVTWAMNDTSDPGKYTTTLSDAFSVVIFDPGVMALNPSKPTLNITDGDAQKVTTGLNYTAKTGKTDVLTWSVKPAAGLTFTPTKLTGYVNRDGTDVENGIIITAKMGDGTMQTLGTWTALRSGKTSAGQKYGDVGIYQYNIELTADQQAALTGAETFYLSSTVGVGSTKSGGFGEVTITGTVTGTVADVNKYTLSAAAAPADGGSVSISPKADIFEEGAVATLTATPNFGYHFVNWTDAGGNEVSTEAEFNYTVNANAELTANFKAVNTYELAYAVDGGANLYMVQPTPAPTVIDGKNMYEEGTEVTLTASSNKVLTFTNWDNGTTSAELKLTMDGNKSVKASYTAIDFIAGWDFYKVGYNGRKADFYAELNDNAALNLVNEEGDIQGWLDKSQEAGQMYEGKYGAVNWRVGSDFGDVGNYFWKVNVNASNFSNIKVSCEMLYNYNSYTTYNVEYSLNNTDWTKAGSITMEGRKKWTPSEVTLPAEANNAETLYIRWIADKTSKIDGAESKNDGNSITNIYIIGDVQAVYDPVAPSITSTVPAEGASGSSATGKIVLSFDKRVKVAEGATATLNEMSLTPTVSGKTITFQYKNLSYSTDYTFTLPANTVSNMSDVFMTSPVTIHFTTMTKPEIAKGLYDFVVPTDGTLEAAIAAANNREDQTKRYRIFVMKGDYKLPQSTTENFKADDGKTYPSPITKLLASNISIIGEDMSATVVTNTITPETYDGGYGPASVYEKIGVSDVLQIQSAATDTYFQDITIKSGIGDKLGRNIAVQDKGSKTIYKNVCLYGYQDTWVSNNDRGLYYFEGGNLRGRTDYLCGKGDAYFNSVDLVMCEEGGYLAVPSQSLKYGYVFKDCVIKGETAKVDGNYKLGRPWGTGTPAAYFIDTKMEAQPISAGWDEMGTGYPKRFAEWNSTTSAGTPIDLSARKKVFGGDHANNPVLTEAEAAEISDMSNMFGEWQPALYTEQAAMPSNVKLDKETKAMTWDNSNYVLGWVVFKNGEYAANVIEPAYTVDDAEATWTVRAANEMGGLGEAATATVVTGINEIGSETGDVVSTAFYNLQGIRVNDNYRGVVVKVCTMKDGSKTTVKTIK